MGSTFQFLVEMKRFIKNVEANYSCFSSIEHEIHEVCEVMCGMLHMYYIYVFPCMYVWFWFIMDGILLYVWWLPRFSSTLTQLSITGMGSASHVCLRTQPEEAFTRTVSAGAACDLTRWSCTWLVHMPEKYTPHHVVIPVSTRLFCIKSAAKHL